MNELLRVPALAAYRFGFLKSLSLTCIADLEFSFCQDSGSAKLMW